MRVLIAAILLLFAVTRAFAQRPEGVMIELTLPERRVEGTAIDWSPSELRLLGRDGHLWQFPPQDVNDFRTTGDRFQSYSISQMRAMLLREFGNEYEVSSTGHYLVVHPSGRRDQWAWRFEELYRAFDHYFTVRGFKLSTPPFPLVGIAFPDREAFARYASQGRGRRANAVLGFYALTSNRISLYDAGMGTTDGPGWQLTASTIIHEATHQIAFNRGIHSRYAPPPLWAVEGLATLFEAPGVYDARNHPQLADRVNRYRYRVFKEHLLGKHRPDVLADLVASDRMFRSAPGAAYAESWALTFFLVETQARQYAAYLAGTARRPPFSEASAAERIADFTAVFGGDWRMLEARFLRFLRELDAP